MTFKIKMIDTIVHYNKNLGQILSKFYRKARKLNEYSENDTKTHETFSKVFQKYSTKVF